MSPGWMNNTISYHNANEPEQGDEDQVECDKEAEESTHHRHPAIGHVAG